ncbi:DNA primase small subunit [Staphylothermus marinus F1]|uniref:DNA primase small subunit PriS n=1 Tax=Staphylothermus marinus (strain ATCC 43588 / DSM 3639 / JCM 9404 / F1) TaxID=399550 RepID=PRIS_STAMF|nr:DNA primase small subunit domain-containing protein [Staphylothermus marinus]A3DM85.1 RecName: Full=DNA primase small subunit PriS [Staphylothermus marinus F1]ABN69745.1 DNA primase small subunit [Staphylothermus marinus F1]
MSRQESSNKFFIKKILREYYSRKPLEEPLYIHKREIAIHSLEDEAYIRHLSFPSITHLYNFILNEKTPLHLYYSSAYYESPSVNKMELKGWIGSDLMFDLDSDHYPGCDKILSICIEENTIYDGKIKTCPKTESKPVIHPLIKTECIQKAYRDALRIKYILEDELGLKNIKIYFSGNRGFHVKVIDEKIWDLESDERREIASYISLENFDINKLFPVIGKRKKYVIITRNEHGIRKRVLDYVIKNNIVNGNELFIKLPLKLLEETINDLTIPIDIVVTMDISRLSRFGNSINGKSGLITKLIEPLDNYEFDINDFCPWSGNIVVKPLIDISGLQVFDEKIDLKRGVKKILDSKIAVYLTLKGIVKIISDEKLVIKNV